MAKQCVGLSPFLWHNFTYCCLSAGMDKMNCFCITQPAGPPLASWSSWMLAANRHTRSHTCPTGIPHSWVPPNTSMNRLPTWYPCQVPKPATHWLVQCEDCEWCTCSAHPVSFWMQQGKALNPLDSVHQGTFPGSNTQPCWAEAGPVDLIRAPFTLLVAFWIYPIYAFLKLH